MQQIRPLRLFQFLNRILLAVSCAFIACVFSASNTAAQTVFLDFNSVGQYTNNFAPWNDGGNLDAGNYSFSENLTAGINGAGGVSVFLNGDTTATWKTGSWDFSTSNSTIFLSLMVKANGQTGSGNKVQLGIANSFTNGLYNNPGVVFETFRFIPAGAQWSLREQYRTTNSMIETTLGTVNYIVGNWYKFTMAFTNISGNVGTYTAGCAIYDYGADGQTPNTNIVTFSTVRTNLGQEIAMDSAVYPSFRAIQNAGIDAWDNFLVYTLASKPTFTIPLTNSFVAVGHAGTFVTLAEGPGNISYSWFTNGVLVSGASGSTYVTGPLNNALTNVTVVAANGNGSVTNSATVLVYAYTAPVITNTPATGITVSNAIVGGQVLSTGGDTPTVTLYYGPANGGSVASKWSNSIPIGALSGSFTQNISGLNPFTTYYFTSKAVNLAGTVWASPSFSFTTLAPTLPVLTNLPATSLQTTGATLNGQVLSTGISTPTVTIFYGPANGGTNAGSWSNSVSMGPQTNTFSQAVTGLLPSTTYYFAARGVNTSGTNWAVPSQSLFTLSTNPPSTGAVAVLTYHNDNARLGANTNETTLTLGNVNSNSFGLVARRPVDDWVYAQPLIMTNVAIPGRGNHNIVIICTVNDSIYAFDADDLSVTIPYWQTNYLGPNIVAPKNSDMTGACGGNYQDFHGNMGIVGTPVIDPVSLRMYVLVRTKENNVNYVQKLHAIDVRTGLDVVSPVVVAATYPGNGEGGTVLTFNPQKEGHRCGLALGNGRLYLAWSSHCDWGPYHGWLLAYDPVTLAMTSVYNTTPNGGLGGIWMSGEPPAIDTAGNLYFMTGNGSFDVANNNYSDSFLKVATTNNALSLVDYFTPYNQATLNGADNDVGSAGNILLPVSAGSLAHPNLVMGGSKAGTIYLIDRDSMGHFNAANDSQIVQSVVGGAGRCYDTPAYWNNRFYITGSGDPLKCFTISNAVISASPVSTSPTTYGFSAPTASVSANGNNNAIVWALQVDGWGSGLPAVLRAYNATNLNLELYNSSQAGTRDQAYGAVKFSVPTVANGKVYVGGQYGLAIYGNASAFVATPTISPNGGVFTTSVAVTLATTTPGASIYYTLNNTDPTTSSTLYTGPFQITNSVAVRAKAYKAGAVESGVASATFLNSSVIGNGTGLQGLYWANHFPTNAFSGSPNLVRTDPTVNFNWGAGAPDPTISTDHFTVRWVGTVQPQFNEPYTFYTATDDGVRLWVNNQLVIDKWVDQGTTEWSGSLSNSLVAQQKYNIQMEYYENGGGAAAMLSWSSPSTSKTVIPQTQLYPTTNQLPTVTITSPVNSSSFTAAASVTISANASETGGSIASVAFYANNTFLGAVSNAPFVNTAVGLGVGSYALTARATDGVGVTVTSAPVNITVIAGSGQPYGVSGRVASSAFLNMPSSGAGFMPPKLSQTGAFSDVASMTPAASLIPYGVNVPLWSDGALKTRWMMVPNNGVPFTPDEQIAFSPTGEWTFPAGTVFVKHFELNTDETNPAVKRRLETRLLVRDSFGAVYGVTYKWKPDNSDADLLSGSLNEDINITNATGIRTQTWYYPSPADCVDCHNPVANFVLGVKTRQLNGNFLYPTTATTDNQLRSLNRVGMFYPAIDESSIGGYSAMSALTNVSASLEDRARSYIDANCAQCHRPGGDGPTFDARYDTPLASQNIVNAILQKGDLGFDNARVVVPKDVWRSILYDRMNTLDDSVKMPDVARNLNDTNAVQIIGDWINSLPGTPALAPPTIFPPGGSFAGSVNVTLTAGDTNATIRYTLDNSLPTTNSTLYTGPFALTGNTILKVKAFETELNESVAASATFAIRPSIFFVTPGYFSNNQFQLQLSGITGKSYVLQGTIDFSNWVSISTNTAPTDVFSLQDPGATNQPYRFYRAIELP